MVQVQRCTSLQETEGVGTMSRIEHTFSEQKDLIAALSERILEDLQNAIDTKGKASLMLQIIFKFHM